MKYNLSGQRFARLTVLSLAFIKRDVGTVWLCKCDCGATKEIIGRSLRSGATRSCGCLQREAARAVSQTNITHGFSHSRRIPEYNSWSGMRRRCYDPRTLRYDRYGGRGITVCERWQSFENFLADMGRKPSPFHSIERLDNDGNYEPNNCCWGTAEQQTNNTSRNRFIEFNGTRKTLAQWSKTVRINSDTLSSRIKRGWSVSDSLSLSVPAAVAVSPP